MVWRDGALFPAQVASHRREPLGHALKLLKPRAHKAAPVILAGAFKAFWYHQVLSSALFSAGRASVELSICLKVTFLIDNLGELPVVKGALQYSSAASWDSTVIIS